MTEHDCWCADDADNWSDPILDGVRHAMPGDDGRLPCCGAHPTLIPCGDSMTAGADRVTCTGPASA